MTTVAGRTLTAETQWCPPSTRYGLEDEERRWRRRKAVRWQDITKGLHILKCRQFIIEKVLHQLKQLVMKVTFNSLYNQN